MELCFLRMGENIFPFGKDVSSKRKDIFIERKYVKENALCSTRTLEYVTILTTSKFIDWDWQAAPVYTGAVGGLAIGGHAMIVTGWGTGAAPYWISEVQTRGFIDNGIKIIFM